MTARDPIAEAIVNFDWHNYRLDEVAEADREYADALAERIRQAAFNTPTPKESEVGRSVRLEVFRILAAQNFRPGNALVADTIAIADAILTGTRPDNQTAFVPTSPGD